MLMPDRHSSTEAYRYGFNGMEVDNEVSGTGNHMTTPFRQYSPRLGRWMTTDPIVHSNQSPFTAFNDNPIYYADPSGLKGEGGSNGNAPSGPGMSGDGGGGSSGLPTIEDYSPSGTLTASNSGGIFNKIKGGGLNVPYGGNNNQRDPTLYGTNTEGFRTITGADRQNVINHEDYRIALGQNYDIKNEPGTEGELVFCTTCGASVPNIPGWGSYHTISRTLKQNIITSEDFVTVGGITGNVYELVSKTGVKLVDNGYLVGRAPVGTPALTVYIVDDANVIQRVLTLVPETDPVTGAVFNVVSFDLGANEKLFIPDTGASKTMAPLAGEGHGTAAPPPVVGQLIFGVTSGEIGR